MPDSLINVSVATEALSWICLLAAIIAVACHILRRHRPAPPREPAVYRLQVSRPGGTVTEYDVTFDGGRPLTEHEDGLFDDLFKSFHHAEGEEDPDRFIEKVLDAYHDGTGIRGNAYQTPITKMFRP